MVGLLWFSTFVETMSLSSDNICVVIVTVVPVGGRNLAAVRTCLFSCQATFLCFLESSEAYLQDLRGWPHFTAGAEVDAPESIAPLSLISPSIKFTQLTRVHRSRDSTDDTNVSSGAMVTICYHRYNIFTLVSHFPFSTLLSSLPYISAISVIMLGYFHNSRAQAAPVSHVSNTQSQVEEHNIFARSTFSQPGPSIERGVGGACLTCTP